ncbi:MAG TPA: NAD-dependent protein deacylase [Candidatus Omnitrophota bacterium]|nr:NAD-dependent protein deacylase [Candidatus Omnitrophota bacterium]
MGLNAKKSGAVDEVVRLLKKARSLIFITGAGISADSGLPTYRGISGLYNDKVTEDGIPIEMALAGETLRTRPEITWKYLSKIEENCRGAKFNRAHTVIAEMEKHFERVWVLTQNIDGFHHAAGSKNIIDIHGDMHQLLCPKCVWRARIEDYGEINIPPLCPECGSIARPDVVFFGEMLPVEKYGILQRELAKGFDIYFSIGTTSVFPYIQEPVLDAKRRNKPAIEINPAATEVSEWMDIKLPLGAACALDEIWKRFLA